MRDRAMAGFPIRTNTEANRAFLRCLDWIVSPAIDLEATPSAFIECKLRLNQFRTILNNPARSLVSPDFLISSCHKDDITFEGYAAAFEKQHRHSLHSDH